MDMTEVQLGAPRAAYTDDSAELLRACSFLKSN